MSSDIPEDKIAEARKIFDLFDINKDSTISSTELGKALNALEVFPTEEELATLMNQVDTNKNGKIEFEEFLAFFVGSGKL